MDAETVKSEFVPVENGPVSQSMGNGAIPDLNEAITFGSHGPEEAVNGQKDVVDNWPAAAKVHSFYFVRYRSYEDPKSKARMSSAKQDVESKKQVLQQILDKLQALKSKRYQITKKISPLSEENNRFKSMLDEKKKNLEPLNEALRPKNSGERGGNIPSSEQELNKLIKNLQYHIQHESIPLKEEKLILKEIKQLEATREHVVAKDAHRAKIEESLGGKQALQDQVNLIGDGFSGMKKERLLVAEKIKELIKERTAIDEEIKKLEDEREDAKKKLDKAREPVYELNRNYDTTNKSFYQNQQLWNKAKTIALKQDIAALKEFVNVENEKFMKMWDESKTVREDYERRILPSFDRRGMTKDGRTRNPNEKLLFAPEPSTSSKPESTTVLKPKQTKKEPAPESQNKPESTAVPTEKSQKEVQSKPIKKAKNMPIEDDYEYTYAETKKPEKVEKKIDEAKLKEIRREEEIAKAKQALERKKKLAEKAAAKAAIKAQKEAEKKKLKDQEKLKKKTPASALELQPEEQPTEAEGVVEPEKSEETTDKPVVTKIKGLKASVKRNRTRSMGPDSISKAILKRKKSTNYWIWAAPAAVSVMIVFVIGYKYLI